jgi:hypothetical protein
VGLICRAAVREAIKQLRRESYELRRSKPERCPLRPPPKASEGQILAGRPLRRPDTFRDPHLFNQETHKPVSSNTARLTQRLGDHGFAVWRRIAHGLQPPHAPLLRAR